MRELPPGPWTWLAIGPSTYDGRPRTETPWDGTEKGLANLDQLRSASGEWVLSGVPHNDDTAGLEPATVAIAHAITALPDLLAACRLVLEHDAVDRFLPGVDYVAIRAAVSKAEGRSP